jgi:MFS family permease
LLVLVFSLMIWKFMLQMVSPYESVYVFAIGGSGVTLGILSTVRMLFSTSFRIPGGYIADKRGRRRVIGLAIIASGLGYVFYIVAQSWVWLLPGVVILSLTALAEPATEAIKADSVNPENRGRGYAIINTLPDIPALIAPALGGYLIVDEGSHYGISLTGIRSVYGYLLVGVVLAGLIRLFFLKDIHQPSSEDVKHDFSMFRDAFNLVKESEISIRRLLFLGGFFMFCFHLDSSMRAVYAIDVGGLSTVQWGWIVTITSVFSLVAGLFIGGLVDRFGRKRVFIPSILVLGGSTLIFVLSKSYPLFLLARILGGIGLYGRMISFQVLVADSVPGAVRGRIMAVYTIFSSLGSSSAILLSGFLYDFFQELPFIVSVVAYLLAAGVAVKFLDEPEVKHL